MLREEASRARPPRHRSSDKPLYHRRLRRPPSIRMASPVMNLASSEAMKAIAAAMSSGLPTSAGSSFSAPDFTLGFSHSIGVPIAPGRTVLARMPLARPSIEAERGTVPCICIPSGRSIRDLLTLPRWQTVDSRHGHQTAMAGERGKAGDRDGKHVASCHCCPRSRDCCAPKTCQARFRLINRTSGGRGHFHEPLGASGWLKTMWC